MKEITVTMYETSDGKVFDCPIEARRYEVTNKLANLIDDLSVRSVYSREIAEFIYNNFLDIKDIIENAED